MACTASEPGPPRRLRSPAASGLRRADPQSPSEAWRYEREHSREFLQQRLRAAQHAGHDLGAVIDQITEAPMDRARSISSVLHGHLQRLDLPDLGHDVTACVARCPDAFRAWSRAGQPLE